MYLLGEMDKIQKPEVLPEHAPPNLISSLKRLAGVQHNNGVYEAWVEGTLGENDPDIFLLGLYNNCYEAYHHREKFIQDTIDADNPLLQIAEDDLTVVTEHRL